MNISIESLLKKPEVRQLLTISKLELEKTKMYPIMDLIMPHTICLLFTDGETEYLLFPTDVLLEPRNYVSDPFTYTFQTDRLYRVPKAMKQLRRMYRGYETSEEHYSAFKNP